MSSTRGIGSSQSILQPALAHSETVHSPGVAYCRSGRLAYFGRPALPQMTHVGAGAVRINGIPSCPAGELAARKLEEQRRIGYAAAEPCHGGALDSIAADERKQNRKIERQLRDVELAGQVGPSARMQQRERYLGQAVGRDTRGQPLRHPRPLPGVFVAEP